METLHVRQVLQMLQLALRESPVRGLCWPSQPWVGTEMGTLEPELGKEVNCGAHVCKGTSAQGFPARYSHPICACLWSCCRHTAWSFFSHSNAIKRLIRDAGKEHQEAWSCHIVVPGRGCCHQSIHKASPRAGPQEGYLCPAKTQSLVYPPTILHLLPIGHSFWLAGAHRSSQQL